jgi:anaphase-promoting complex subunit 6
MSCPCISSNNNTTEDDCVPLYFFICCWTSETSLLSSIQFGTQDGWLSSFYSCLIKKVSKNETSICPSLSIKVIKDLYILILFNLWRFTLQTLTCCVFQYDKENIVEANFGELEKEGCNSNTSDLSFIHTLKTNTDLLACKAEYYHQCGEYQKCFELTSL